MDHTYKVAWLKARLLSGRTVKFDSTVPANLCGNNTENHHYDRWIFIRLNHQSRVRLVVQENNPTFSIYSDPNYGLCIEDTRTKEVLIEGVELEKAVVHAPEQLFLGLYEYCKIGCRFCPLHIENERRVHYSLDSIFEDIDASAGKPYSSIGITTSIPFHLTSEDVADEMAFVVQKIREKLGPVIPIGVSTRIPSERVLNRFKEAGADEIRLNIEVPSPDLAQQLMPNKPLEEIYASVEKACKVFGKGKVSSNIMLGIGENDQDVIAAIRRLAEMGAIATLYAFDPFDSNADYTSQFSRPSAERLYELALAHKDILDEFNLDPLSLKTMCPACSASHIYPGRDL